MHICMYAYKDIYICMYIFINVNIKTHSNLLDMHQYINKIQKYKEISVDAFTYLSMPVLYI
jgi:hypothetical protein